MDDMPSYPLRALSIGEIFDRAVTIFVRNFAVFTAIVFTLLAPNALAQFLLIPADQADLSAVLQQMQHPTTSSQAAMGPGALVAVFGLGALVLLLAPFVNNAVAVGVADLYNGRRPEYGRSFAVVFRRWLPLLATSIVSFLIIVAVYTTAVVVIALVAIIGVAFVKAVLPLAIIMFVLAAVGTLALLLALMMLVLVYVFATYATSLEDAGVGRAIGSAFRRILNRTEFRKALLMALAYLALEMGVLTISSMVTIAISLLTKSYALQLAFSSIFSALFTAFLATLVAVYYYDVRTRSEGLDLEVDLGRLTATA